MEFTATTIPSGEQQIKVARNGPPKPVRVTISFDVDLPDEDALCAPRIVAAVAALAEYVAANPDGDSAEWVAPNGVAVRWRRADCGAYIVSSAAAAEIAREMAATPPGSIIRFKPGADLPTPQSPPTVRS